MKKAKITIISIVALLGVMTLVPSYTAAASPASQIQSGSDAAGGTGQTSNLGAEIKIVVNVLLYILGAVAVVMIVIGGLRYTTSNGDSSAISSAKNTILYSVIGLIVAILAYAIVNFVLSSFK
jgi:hypothetical protein